MPDRDHDAAEKQDRTKSSPGVSRREALLAAFDGRGAADLPLEALIDRCERTA
ncbi:MAG: hypothetical protein KDK03_01950 [Rhodobacteraceae bacterium]|nr:hypothetical protein [Paracoccaceae bacterium]